MSKNKIIVFSTPSCPWCVRVKQYLMSKKLPFKDIDVSRDQAAANEMIKKSGQQGVPQLWVNGGVVIGFDQQKIDNYLITE